MAERRVAVIHKQNGSTDLDSQPHHSVDRAMINFIDGEIIFVEKNILAVSIDELDNLSEHGVIEKRKDAVGSYYYVEDEEEGLRFGVMVSLRESKIQWLRLHWLDRPMKGWDDVSVEGVKHEYHLLSNLVAKIVGRPPHIKRNSEHTWCLGWGKIVVSFDLRAFQADIFMVPR